jgi:Glycosyl transferase family 41
MSNTAATDEDLALARAEILYGRAEQAIARLLAMIESHSFSPVLHYWLSAAYGAAGRHEEQAETLRTAQAFHSLQVIRDNGGDVSLFNTDTDYALAVADQFIEVDLMGPASLGMARGVMVEEASGAALLGYGATLFAQGRTLEAETALSVGAEDYEFHPAHSALLSILPYCQGGTIRHAFEAMRWGAINHRHPDEWPTFTNSRATNRPLRVGFLIYSLSASATAEGLETLLTALGNVQATVYCDNADQEMAIPGVVIRSIGHLSDDAAQAVILADQIDVLVDCEGHGGESRLLIMARRAAPVQVSWNPFGLTTGLPTIDYALVTDLVAQKAGEMNFVEALWPVGQVLSPFGRIGSVDTLEAPTHAADQIVLASLAHPATMDEKSIRLWAETLRNVPKAQLWLKHRYFVDPVLQNTMSCRFAAYGIDPDRMVYLERGETSDSSIIHAGVDLVLAPTGQQSLFDTSILQALADGVPVITLALQNDASATNPLDVLGLKDCIASSEQVYVEQVIRLTYDRPGLNRQRSAVALLFQSSAYGDVLGFARRLEKAFSDMYAAWALRNISVDDRKNQKPTAFDDAAERDVA